MLDLESHLQHYAWGSETEIPALLRKAPDGRPWAEAWFGAHPMSPSFITGGPSTA